MKALALIFFLSLPVQADIYKCSTPTGDIVFQQNPCGSLKAETYNPTPPSVISGPSNSSSYNSTTSPTYQRYEQRVEEADQRWCQFYQDKLTSTQERWDAQRRQGYTQREKDRYQQHIKDAERAVIRNCN